MNKRIYILALVIALIFGACKKDITDLNVNPNDSQTPNPDLLFKHSVKRGMSNYLTATNLEYNGIAHWVMYFSSPDIPILIKSTISLEGWQMLKDTFPNKQMCFSPEFLRAETANEDFRNMKYTIIAGEQKDTEFWKYIPYSEALQGNPELSLAPGYDTQQEVYTRLFADLELAASLLDDTAVAINADSDLLFAGNIDSWRRFANSLRFRLAMRVSNVNEALANEVLTDLESADLFESNAGSAEFQFNSVFNNPLNEAGNIRFSEGAQYVNPSKFLVDLLLEKDDPRIKFYIEEASLYDTFDFLDRYKGVPSLLPFTSEEWGDYNLDETLGDPNGEWGDVSRIGEFFMTNERPVPLLSYSELCFLQAEASLRGLWSGNADELVKEGVRAHIEQMNFHNYSDHEAIEEQDIAEYVNAISGVDLEEVITQKWLLFTYENTLEAFSEYRRTGFPTLVDFYGVAIENSLFPQRLKYPNSEFTLNQENYLEALELQGSDELTTPLWWTN